MVGNPVRGTLLQQRESLKVDGENEQVQAKKGFGFNPAEPLILILGGSQGAERLNNFVLENLEILIKDSQALHQVGDGNYDSYKKEFFDPKFQFSLSLLFYSLKTEDHHTFSLKNLQQHYLVHQNLKY